VSVATLSHLLLLANELLCVLWTVACAVAVVLGQPRTAAAPAVYQYQRQLFTNTSASCLPSARTICLSHQRNLLLHSHLVSPLATT
jgi:hypothetical protein